MRYCICTHGLLFRINWIKMKRDTEWVSVVECMSMQPNSNTSFYAKIPFIHFHCHIYCQCECECQGDHINKPILPIDVRFPCFIIHAHYHSARMVKTFPMLFVPFHFISINTHKSLPLRVSTYNMQVACYQHCVFSIHLFIIWMIWVLLLVMMLE